jgi:beta-glucosidase
MPALTRRTPMLDAAKAAGTMSAAPATTSTPAVPLVGSDNGGHPKRAPEPEHRLELRFPDDFVWGAATSAYQIEGATAEDGRGESVWDTFSHTVGRVRNGDTGDVAADHYHRLDSDLDLMKWLGLHSYRFSISWSRIVPDGAGQLNRRGIDFYRRLVDGLHERGISPMATLFHWDLPQRLQDKGGWESRDVAYHFADYASIVFDALGSQVPVWLTINEPKTVVQNGYLLGSHAPGRRDEDAAYLVAHHLMLAHGLAVQALRSSPARDTWIGPAFNLHPTYPVDDSPAAQQQAYLRDGFENRLYLDSVFRGAYPADVLAAIGPDSPMVKAIRDGDLDVIATPVDLLAVQYYCPYYIDASGEAINLHPTSEAFWQQIYPEGMYDILTRVKRDYGDIPLSVTENGLPTADRIGDDGLVDDPGRVGFLRDHFAAAHRAMTEGVNLQSYHVWSLMDNFEWQQGYAERWGLIYVDYTTQRRIPKRSAHWYRGVIADNEV